MSALRPARRPHLLQLSPEELGACAFALRRWLGEYHRAGAPPPRNLVALVERLAAAHDRTRHCVVVVGPTTDDGSATEDLLVTLGDVASIVGLGRRTIERHVAQGLLRVRKLGHAVRVHPDDLAAYLEGTR